MAAYTFLPTIGKQSKQTGVGSFLPRLVKGNNLQQKEQFCVLHSEQHVLERITEKGAAQCLHSVLSCASLTSLSKAASTVMDSRVRTIMSAALLLLIASEMPGKQAEHTNFADFQPKDVALTDDTHEEQTA
jgi:hypothetical protein